MQHRFKRRILALKATLERVYKSYAHSNTAKHARQPITHSALTWSGQRPPSSNLYTLLQREQIKSAYRRSRALINGRADRPCALMQQSNKSCQLASFHSGFEICRGQTPRMLLRCNGSRNGSSPSFCCSNSTFDRCTACFVIMKHIYQPEQCSNMYCWHKLFVYMLQQGQKVKNAGEAHHQQRQRCHSAVP